MDTITSRTNYLNKDIVDGIAQYDLGSFDYDDFDFGKEEYLIVRKNEECRPDLLSYRAYGTQNYWWFICSYNKFSDIWNDIVENQVIWYPNIQKVREFLKWRLSRTRDNRPAAAKK